MQTKGQLMKSLHTAFSFAPPSILSLTISVYIIPTLYGFVIVRLSAFIERNCGRLSLCLEYVGSVTIPIMFLHEPLNRFCPMSNYLLIYLLIGMGIPVVFSIAVSRFEYCKYFGIPKRKIAKRYRC